MEKSFRKGEGRKGGQSGQKVIIDSEQNPESRKRIHEREIAELMKKAEEKTDQKRQPIKKDEDVIKEDPRRAEKANAYQIALRAADEAKAEYDNLLQKTERKLIELDKKINNANKKLPLQPSLRTKEAFQVRIQELEEILAAKGAYLLSPKDEDDILKEIKGLAMEMVRVDEYNEAKVIVDYFLKEKAVIDEIMSTARENLNQKNRQAARARNRL
jgi:hypothetical protein